MSQVGRGYDINKTFIIEPLETSGSTGPVVSACTAVYTNNILSCSGNTQIFLNDSVITFDGNIYTNDSLSASTINASTFYSGGTNLFDIISLKNITGGTFNPNLDVLTLVKEDNSSVIITGFTDYYTTGATLIGNTVYFDRNDLLSAYTVNLSGFSTDDIYTTGLTFNNNQLIIVRNDGVSLNTFINNFTGLTITGLLNSNSISANTISATTFYGDGSNLTGISTQDTYVTGGTYSNGTAIFTNNSGGTFNVNGFYTGFSGGTIDGLTANTISATTYLNLPLDIFVTGGTYDNSIGLVSFTNNTGGTFNINGFYTGYTLTTSEIETVLGYIPLSAYTDTYVTGGTYSNGVIVFTNNTGGTFTVNSLYTGSTDVYVTGGTYSNGSALFTNNTGGTFTVSGFLNADIYWVSGSTGLFSIKANNNSGLDATGNYALAEGIGTLASGIGSHAEGEGTIAEGQASHAEGQATTAQGINSHAGGFRSIAKGDISFVHGSGSAANGASTIVLGDNIDGVDANTVYVPNIQFHLENSGSTLDVGRMKWNDEDGTVDLRLKGNNVTLQLGQEQLIRVVNKTGANLLESQYRVVRFRRVDEGGAQGQRPAVVLALGNNDPNSVDTIGLVTENIDDNQEGFITTSGIVRGINTTGSLQGETWVDGDVLYLSPTVAGGLTKVKPTAPNHTVTMGYVIYAHINQGKIFVKVDNGYELDELHNVNITGTTTNGQWLEYDSTLSAWTNTSNFDFSLNFISSFTYPIILPYNWSVSSIDNPSSIGVDLSTSAGTYTFNTNISEFTETLTVSASTSGFINLNCSRIN